MDTPFSELLAIQHKVWYNYFHNINIRILNISKKERMKTANPDDQQTDLDRVLEKINEIAKASADGDYIYRGETSHHQDPPDCGKVSSSLYREYRDIEAEYFDIAFVQEEILREAREYASHKMDDFELTATLQHHGDKTNLIDFTTDYLVALFFACDGKPEKPGRVILLQRQSKAYKVEKPPKAIRRAEIQKSIFVQAPKGFVQPDKVVSIPADLKSALLDHLRKHHDISTKTIYNDLQGFIEKRGLHKSAYTEFYKGLTCQNRGKSAKPQAEKQKWYDDAITHYTEAIRLNPDLIAAYNNRGNAYGEKSDFDAAIQDYNKAIDLNPELAEAYTNRGNAYDEKSDFDAAIQDYNKAIDLNPELAEAYTNRGNAYHEKGDFDKAIQDHNKAIDLNPEYANAYTNRGTAYAKTDDFDAAIQDYNKAIDLNPELAEAYSNRGNAYHEKGDFDKAIQDHNKAIALNPEDDEAYYNRGDAYGEKSDFDAAIQDYNKAIALNPEDADVYINRGITHYRKGEVDKAIQDFNTTIELNPEDADAYANRGEAWLHLKEWERAKADLMTAKKKGVDIVDSFQNDYESVEDFEAKNEVKLPEDIAALLRGE